jgi:hypothetical protein
MTTVFERVITPRPASVGDFLNIKFFMRRTETIPPYARWKRVCKGRHVFPP